MATFYLLSHWSKKQQQKYLGRMYFVWCLYSLSVSILSIHPAVAHTRDIYTCIIVLFLVAAVII